MRLSCWTEGIYYRVAPWCQVSSLLFQRCWGAESIRCALRLIFVRSFDYGCFSGAWKSESHTASMIWEDYLPLVLACDCKWIVISLRTWTARPLFLCLLPQTLSLKHNTVKALFNLCKACFNTFIYWVFPNELLNLLKTDQYFSISVKVGQFFLAL